MKLASALILALAGFVTGTARGSEIYIGCLADRTGSVAIQVHLDRTTAARHLFEVFRPGRPPYTARGPVLYHVRDGSLDVRARSGGADVARLRIRLGAVRLDELTERGRLFDGEDVTVAVSLPGWTAGEAFACNVARL